VYVVNKRLSLVDPSGGWKPPTTTGPTNIPAGPASGKSGKIASVLGKVGAVTGAGLAGYEIGGLINQGLGWISEKLTGGAYKGEGFLGEAIYDLIHMMENRGDGESKPEINIYYDPWTGQAMAESESMKPEINLRRGRF